jgi:hypothetical protein
MPRPMHLSPLGVAAAPGDHGTAINIDEHRKIDTLLWGPNVEYPNGRFEAATYGPSCAQAMSGTAITDQSEDCLSLKHWARHRCSRGNSS